jgi:hypothetical protein
MKALDYHWHIQQCKIVLALFMDTIIIITPIVFIMTLILDMAVITVMDMGIITMVIAIILVGIPCLFLWRIRKIFDSSPRIEIGLIPPTCRWFVHLTPIQAPGLLPVGIAVLPGVIRPAVIVLQAVRVDLREVPVVAVVPHVVIN